MKSTSFGAYIKSVREKKNLAQRKVANHLDIDTSTLSKIELGQRQLNLKMIKGLSEILELDFKTLQVRFISENLLMDYKGEPYIEEALTLVIEQIKK
jgi:transcriptional regulator with XRE-family HTH domain